MKYRNVDSLNLTPNEWRQLARLPRGYLPISMNPTAKPRAVTFYRLSLRRAIRRRS